MIFRHLDSSSLYVAGQVCKRWSDIVQIVHDESWRSLTKAVMLKAEIIGPKYKSRGWVEQDHSWKTCNCINIGRELVLYEDIELLVHDMEIIENASLNSRQDRLEIITLEEAKAAIRFAAAGILTTIDYLNLDIYLRENDDFASVENMCLLVKITKNELFLQSNVSKHFINLFSHIHCTYLEVLFYEEILTDMEIKSLTEVLNDGVEKIVFRLVCCINFPYIENYDGRGKCQMIEFEYIDEPDEEYESDVQKLQEWANSNGWTVDVFNQPNYEFQNISLTRIDQ